MIRTRQLLLFAPAAVVAATALIAAWAGALPAAAQKSPSVRRQRSASAVYTPPAGSTERKMILDALRQDVRNRHQLKTIFVVRHLKAHRSGSSGWAFLEADPSSPDGRNQYEPVSALLRRQRGRWKVVDYVGEGGDSNKALAVEYKRLRSRYPTAPAGIFPRHR